MKGDDFFEFLEGLMNGRTKSEKSESEVKRVESEKRWLYLKPLVDKYYDLIKDRLEAIAEYRFENKSFGGCLRTNLDCYKNNLSEYEVLKIVWRVVLKHEIPRVAIYYEVSLHVDLATVNNGECAHYFLVEYGLPLVTNIKNKKLHTYEELKMEMLEAAESDPRCALARKLEQI